MEMPTEWAKVRRYDWLFGVRVAIKTYDQQIKVEILKARKTLPH